MSFLLKQAPVIFIIIVIFTFTFMHLVYAFIQSDLHYFQGTEDLTFPVNYPPGLGVVTPCSTGFFFFFFLSFQENSQIVSNENWDQMLFSKIPNVVQMWNLWFCISPARTYANHEARIYAWNSNVIIHIQILMTRDKTALPLVETHENPWLFAY